MKTKTLIIGAAAVALTLAIGAFGAGNAAKAQMMGGYGDGYGHMGYGSGYGSRYGHMRGYDQQGDGRQAQYPGYGRRHYRGNVDRYPR